MTSSKKNWEFDWDLELMLLLKNQKWETSYKQIKYEQGTKN